MSIRIIVTGGTFDKEYNELQGSLFFRKSHVAEMLRLGRCRLTVKVQTLLMIDSLCMSAAHRRRILQACLSSPEKHIVVTHGTDTMVETAKVLGPKIGDKTVVLTGAMVPYKFGSSDGLFNLGAALAFVQILPHGVYVAMNGRFLSWDNVHKNKKTGEFEERSETSHWN
jgi:L-asparaginase